MSILKINRKTSVNQFEIIFLEAVSNYTCVHTLNGQLVSTHTMKKLLGRLQAIDLLKINRGLTINKAFIAYVDLVSDFPHIIMINKKKLPISRRRLQVVLNNLKATSFI